MGSSLRARRAAGRSNVPRRVAAALAAVGALALLVLAGAAGATPPTLVPTYYPIPTPGANAYDIVSDPSGNVWFSEENTGKIARVSPAGVITEFPLDPLGLRFPTAITTDGQGNVWFASFASVQQPGHTNLFITRFDPSSAQFTPYEVPSVPAVFPSGSCGASLPRTIVQGPDGNIWFDLHGGIGRFSPGGSFSVFCLTGGAGGPNAVAAGPDGNVWFTDPLLNEIGRVTPSGLITEYPVPAAAAGLDQLTGGADGDVWFVEQNVNRMGRVDLGPGGAVLSVTDYPLGEHPYQPLPGFDGRVWYPGGPGLAGIDGSGTVVPEVAFADGASTIRWTPTPLGQIWFIATGNQVLRLDYPLDSTPPVVTGVPDRAANGNGWYAAPVTIDWHAADPAPSSGTPSDPPNTLAQTEGTVSYVSASSCDPANNCATGSLSLSIDLTDPTISGSASPAPNAAGWNSSPVTVGFTCADAVSGTASCSAPVTLGSEGVGQSAAGTAVDRAGRSSSTAVSGIRIDLTDPAVSCSAASFLLDQTGAAVSATVSDALSGPEQPTVSAAVSTASAGQFTVSLTGRDEAGRQRTVACPYTIGFQFSGFSAPVDNPPVTNGAKAGQTIPFKWRLTDADGAPVADPASFVSLTSSDANCSGSGVDDLETYSGGSGLQYLGNGNWQYNWKTPPGYAGQCRLASVNLADGSHHQARFQFR
jgi:streptogramin lyase